MASLDVADLVGEHTYELVVCIDNLKESTVDKDKATRNGKGVQTVVLYDKEAIVKKWVLHVGKDLVASICYVLFHLLVVDELHLLPQLGKEPLPKLTLLPKGHLGLGWNGNRHKQEDCKEDRPGPSL